MEIGNPHSTHSTLRERIVEHVFIGDVLRRLWQLRVTDVEVLRSEFDAGGYDIVLNYHKIVRHIQLKTVMAGGKAAYAKVSLKLMEKPSGCVIWIILSPELHPRSYLWFGGNPGKRLPDIRNMKIAKHTKGNAKGLKTTRPSLRKIPRSRFKQVGTLDALLQELFGPLE